jgi:LPS sulfotransferase NodH
LKTIDSIEPSRPTIFIVGAPRSGTTLLHQLLAQTGAFGYVSNFTARFWKAPAIGLLAEQALNIQDNETSTFESNLGRTEGLNAPHHFSKFWTSWFQIYGHEMHTKPLIEFPELFKRTLGALEELHNKPLLFKSEYCGLQIPLLKEFFPKAKFIFCTREPLYQAQSILLARMKYYGSYETWWSLRPPQYPVLKHRDPFIQAAYQVYYINRAISEGLEKSGAESITLDLRQLTANPKASVEKVLELGGVELPDLSWVPESFEYRREQQLLKEEWDSLRIAVLSASAEVVK